MNAFLANPCSAMSDIFTMIVYNDRQSQVSTTSSTGPPSTEDPSKERKGSIQINLRETSTANSHALSYVQRSSYITKVPEAEVNTCNDLGTILDPTFDSLFHPNEMRLLALVSHNNMKHAMKKFVIANMNVLKKFRLTGTEQTKVMLVEVFGDDPEVIFGPSCQSGPLGGDAQLVALAATGQLGGCIFFMDPMDAHPHSADIDCLNRQGNVHNILMSHNPTSAQVCLHSLREGLKLGRFDMMPSFFFDLESPSVEAYKQRQRCILNDTMAMGITVQKNRLEESRLKSIKRT